MTTAQQAIIDSQVSYSIDQDQAAEDGAQNAYDTAIEQKMTPKEASEISDEVFERLLAAGNPSVFN